MYLLLVEEFNKLNEIVPNIHYGGCTVFAENLYELLIKLGKTPTIIITTSTGQELKGYNEGNFTISQYHINVLHCFIEVDGNYIDNNGIYKAIKEIKHHEDTNYEVVNISLNTLILINKDFNNWNSSFDRGNIDKIGETLKNLYNNLAVSN